MSRDLMSISLGTRHLAPNAKHTVSGESTSNR